MPRRGRGAYRGGLVPSDIPLATAGDQTLTFTVPEDGYLVAANCVNADTNWLKATLMIVHGSDTAVRHALANMVQCNDRGVSWNGRVKVYAGQQVMWYIEDAATNDKIEGWVQIE